MGCSVRSVLSLAAFLLIALLAGFIINQYSPTLLILGILALIIFAISFINIEWGLYGTL